MTSDKKTIFIPEFRDEEGERLLTSYYSEDLKEAIDYASKLESRGWKCSGYAIFTEVAVIRMGTRLED